MKYIKRCEKDYTNDIKNIIALVNGDTKIDDLVSIYYNIPCDGFGCIYDNLRCHEAKIIILGTFAVLDSISANSVSVTYLIKDFIENQFNNKYYISQYEKLMNKDHDILRKQSYDLQLKLSELNHEICTLEKLKEGASK